jgi:hypothetical protein
MDRRNFLMSSGKLMLVTSGLFITGKILVACDHDDNNYGGYYNGYYNGYYDDKQAAVSQNQNQNLQDQATKGQSKTTVNTKGAAEHSDANPKQE